MKSETVILLKEDMERNFLDMNLVNFGGYNSKTTDNKSKKQKTINLITKETVSRR